jgi:4-hydroxybenzoate polyprenyltransferase
MHPLLTKRMGAALAILAVFAGIGVTLMLSTETLYNFGAAFCIVAAILIFSLFFKEMRNKLTAELWVGLD